MAPRPDSIGYQKQKYCTHIESDSGIDCEKHINKQDPEGIHQIKKAHQLAGKTFVVISQEIVDKLRITQDTWFEEDVINGRIVLTIPNRNENGGLI